MRILAFADKKPDVAIHDLVNSQPIDLIVTLGDLERSDILELATITSIPKIGVYGNHCSGNYMDELGIVNMHMRTTTFQGLSIAGFEGCVRYKENPQAIMYTQQEASVMLSQMPPVDIFICHCPPRGINDEEELAHQGFDGLREYIDQNPPQLLMHGHTYPTEENIIRQHGPTRIEYVHKWAIIEI